MSENDSTDRLEADRKKRLKWYYKNRERANEANKKWEQANRERRNKTRMLWYHAHKDDPGYREKRNAQAAARKRANPDKIAAQRKLYDSRKTPEQKKAAGRRNHLKYTFGITVADYDALMQKQNGQCAICGTTDPAPMSCLFVDHDHATDRIRGLLCFHCNSGLGHFRDDPVILEIALDYLRHPFQGDPSAPGAGWLCPQ